MNDQRRQHDSHIASPHEVAELTRLSAQNPEFTQAELGRRLGLFWWRNAWRHWEK